MKEYTIRPMTIADYPKVWALWETIKGFALRHVDDSYEGVERFLARNAGLSVVAESDGEIIGSILCGHDGRRGSLYHVCVREDCRRQGIGRAMVRTCVDSLKREKISKITLIAFVVNDTGNRFWNDIGWVKRRDVNTYDLVINPDNIVTYNE